jgi:hypothetical protein
MADSKISALPASTTPLAGTEVLPIVQSSTTKQVSVANLTAGRAVSALSIATTTDASFATTSGSVGVGTASPQALLHVGAVAEAPGFGNTTQMCYVNGTSQPELLIRETTNDVVVSMYADSTSGAIRTPTNHPLVFATNNTERMRIDATGSLLVGTTTVPTTGGFSRAIVSVKQLNDSGAFSGIQIEANANTNTLGIGYDGSNFTFNSSYRTTGGFVPVSFNVGNAERLKINTTGIITMGVYGAGAATFSAAGVISSVSDETWKTKDGVPTNTDAMLQKLEPGYWFYNEEKAPTFGEERQLGFYAQNVNAAIGPEAAPTPETYTELDENGVEVTKTKPWGYYDRSVLAVAVMSLKNALNTIEELKQRITALENK